jgi:hypothetical protein
VPSQPTPILRALEGLEEFSGRTLVIAGPPLSGKSKLLAELRTALAARGARTVNLQGSYRGRSVPYAALDGLRGPPGNLGLPVAGPPMAADPIADELSGVPMAPIAYNPERLPSRRRGRGDRGRTGFLGQPQRVRSANEGDPEAYWREIVWEFRGPKAHPVGLLIEDASLFDSESRDFVVALTRKARLRPFLVALALDTSVPGSGLWEEAFYGRGDVDWVRTTTSAADPREAARLKGLFENLPAPAQRLGGLVAMLGGSVSEVVLSRVARLNFSQLADSLLPAVGIGLVRNQDGKVSMPHREWVGLVPELLPEPQRRRMHTEIAEALSALSPEPSLARRIEVARHYLAGEPGPLAMSRLLEAAEISIHLLSYDSAADLLTEAIDCLAAMSPSDRKPVEPEMRLLYAQALFYAGRPSEAEAQVREGIDYALRAHVSAAELAEWVEPLLLTMRAVGPRPSLATTLVELAERCHDARLTEVEVLLETLIAEFYQNRNQGERARAEALRAAALARRLPERHLQALGLLTIGFSQIDGKPSERELAGRFLRAARVMLGKARRWELEYLAGEYEARLLEMSGAATKAREFREKSITTLQRERLLSVELEHDLGIAEILLDQGAPKGREAVLARARSLAETLHLLPPSPLLLHLWLLDGRQLAQGGQVDAARERWEAVVDLPVAASLPRARAEAMVRLALLDYVVGRPEEARALSDRLSSVELVTVLPTSWQPWLPELERLAPESARGAGPLPPVAAGGSASAGQERERPRHDAG